MNMKVRKNISLCAAMGILAASWAMAQQTAPAAGVPATAPAAPMLGAAGTKSPEVGADGSVIFRLKAPSAAGVGVTGNWMGMMAAPLPMTKGEDGVWQLTVNGLKPEMWTYNFVVDGVRMLDPGNVNVMRDGVRFMSVLTIPGAGSDLYTVNSIPHGTVHQVWYPSSTLNMPQRRMYIYTPAGYERGEQRFPVLYLLHGAGGDEDAWDNLGRAREIFDSLIAAGKAKPMIVVMTNGNWNRAAAPGFADQGEATLTLGSDPAALRSMSNSLKISDSIVADVVPFVDKTYRTVADRDHRAIAGLSMGGAQTLYAGLHNLDLFSYVSSFSGAFIMFPGALKNVPVAPGAPMGPGRGQELDISALPADFPGLDASANQKLHLLYITCGANDGLLKSNQQFMDWLTSQGVSYKQLILPGYMHEWPFWRISLSNMLPMLFH
jgi:enterochelin esterase family protein